MIFQLSIILYYIIRIVQSQRKECTPDKTKCNFNSDKDILLYYSKGLSVNTTKEDNNTFIYCVNEYYKCGHIIEDIDQEFKDKSGIYIASGIDLYSIRNDLTQLYLSFEKDIEAYVEVCGKEAETLLFESPLFLDDFQTDELNEKVYALRYKQMKKYYSLKNITPSIELALLAFYVKYYGHPVIDETQNLITQTQWENISYYISTMKGPYRERKLLSLVIDSFIATHEPYYHIGLLFDSKIKETTDWGKERDFMSKLMQELNVRYTMHSSTKTIAYNTHYKEANQALKEYKYEYNKDEKLQQGINSIYDDFKAKRVFDVYYQNILFLFITNKTDDNTLNLSELHNYGIAIYIIGIVSDSLTLKDLETIAKQFATVIPLSNLNSLNYNQHSLFKMIKSILSNQIDLLTFKKSNEIKVNDITVTKPSSHKYFLINTISIDKHKYHIEMIYHNRIPIDMNIFLSSDIPYPDFYNNENMHLGLSVEKPYLNHESDKPFYIGIFTNELNYSLIITKCSDKDDCDSPSNGLYKSNEVKLIQSRTYSYFSFENCTRKVCPISPVDLFSKYSRGINNTFNDDALFIYDDQFFFNNEIFNCLYDNHYCGYIVANKNSEPEFGVMVGLSLNLSESNQIGLHLKNGLSKIMINKFTPFLNNNDYTCPDDYMKILNDCNLNFTIEEVRRINRHNITYTFHLLDKKFDQCSDQLSVDMKYALLLFQTQKNIELKQEIINDLCNKDYSSYLNYLNQSKDKDNEISINFQSMLIQMSTYNQFSHKVLLSIIVGKSLIINDCLIEFLNDCQFDALIRSISYYDSQLQRVVTVGGFNDKGKEIMDALSTIKEKIRDDDTGITNEHINLDYVLEHQLDLFTYYDYGFKKIILLITKYANNMDQQGTKTIKPPSDELMSRVKDKGIQIVQLTNQDDIISDSNDKEKNWLFKGNKVYYANFDDISINELFKTINNIQIPITQLQPLVTDLIKGEYSFYEFYFKKTKLTEDEEENEEDDDQNANSIKLTFDSNELYVFISKKYPYPSLYNNDIFINRTNENGKLWNIQVKFDEKKDDLTFYMTVFALKDVSYLRIDIEECDSDDVCGTIKTKHILTWTFILATLVILFYGVYHCFCDANTNIKTNIYDRK